MSEAHPHINAEGKFQSDKYPPCPAGKVPLSTEDPTAQDLLWEYAQRRREVDEQFSDDLEITLQTSGFRAPMYPASAWVALRPTLYDFAQVMEHVLHDNDHKGGWEETPSVELMDFLWHTVRVLEHNHLRGYYYGAPEAMRRAAANVANMAMMVADRVHGLTHEHRKNGHPSPVVVDLGRTGGGS